MLKKVLISILGIKGITNSLLFSTLRVFTFYEIFYVSLLTEGIKVILPPDELIKNSLTEAGLETNLLEKLLKDSLSIIRKITDNIYDSKESLYEVGIFLFLIDSMRLKSLSNTNENAKYLIDNLKDSIQLNSQIQPYINDIFSSILSCMKLFGDINYSQDHELNKKEKQKFLEFLLKDTLLSETSSFQIVIDNLNLNSDIICILFEDFLLSYIRQNSLKYSNTDIALILEKRIIELEKIYNKDKYTISILSNKSIIIAMIRISSNIIYNSITNKNKFKIFVDKILDIFSKEESEVVKSFANYFAITFVSTFEIRNCEDYKTLYQKTIEFHKFKFLEKIYQGILDHKEIINITEIINLIYPNGPIKVEQILNKKSLPTKQIIKEMERQLDNCKISYPYLNVWIRNEEVFREIYQLRKIIKFYIALYHEVSMKAKTKSEMEKCQIDTLIKASTNKEKLQEYYDQFREAYLSLCEDFPDKYDKDTLDNLFNSENRCSVFPFLVADDNISSSSPNFYNTLLVPLCKQNNEIIKRLEYQIRKNESKNFSFKFQSIFSLKKINFIITEIKKYDKYFVIDYKAKGNIIFKFDYLEINLSSKLSNLKKINEKDIPRIKFYMEIDRNFEITDVLSKLNFIIYSSDQYKKFIDYLLNLVKNFAESKKIIKELNQGIMQIFSNIAKEELDTMRTIGDAINKLGISNENLFKDLKISELPLIHLRQFYEELEIEIFDNFYNQEKAKQGLDERNLSDLNISLEEKKALPGYTNAKSSLINAIKRCTIRYLVYSENTLKDKPLLNYITQNHLYKSILSNEETLIIKDNWIKAHFEGLLKTHNIKLKHVFTVYCLLNPSHISKDKEQANEKEEENKKKDNSDNEDSEEDEGPKKSKMKKKSKKKKETDL